MNLLGAVKTDNAVEDKRKEDQKEENGTDHKKKASGLI
jgi:hypothetical protein